MWLVNLIAHIQRKHYVLDTAVSLLLKVLSVFFFVLGRLHPELLDIAKAFPTTVYSLQKLLGVQKDMFVRYVTCPNCNTIYQYSQCIEISGTQKCSKRCSKESCKALLLRNVETPNGRHLLYPFKTYCYRPLKESLQHFLNRPGLSESCEKWRDLRKENGMLADIYDGKIWQKFQEYDHKPFLSDPFTYGVMLNVDWFKPFNHVEYSMGAIYLTIMNLPRELRFKQENLLLVGLIPGPKEPSLDINPFLSPLIDELLDFLPGVSMSVHSYNTPQLVRCALLCVACDIPACRKVSGFLGHSATLGCSRCLKPFPGSIGQKDYSGFDRSKWPPRSNEQHWKDVNTIQKCRGKTERSQLESKLGCRYSVLLKLPYFDPVRMSIIDPMHNLYLGTAKTILKNVWLNQGMLTKADLTNIQKCVDSTNVPPMVGRIPLKIASSFAGFTADQFKNWTNLFSLVALHDILPSDHLECWRHFVLASRLLSQMQISLTHVKLADALLLQFCRRVERMYGPSVVTPNMHLHAHIEQCILDYGPVYNFWLFGFERYNGILESFPSNNRCVEIQFMQRFTRETFLYSSSLPQQYESDFHDILSSLVTPVVQGSLQSSFHIPATSNLMQQQKDWTIQMIHQGVQLPKSYFRSNFDHEDISALTQLYAFLYPNFSPSDITFNLTFRKYATMRYCNAKYRSEMSKYRECCIVFAKCCASPSQVRPAIVHYFAQHSFYHSGKLFEHLLVSVSWLKEHHAKQAYGKPLQLWWKDLYDVGISFIPVQFIVDQCVSVCINYEQQTVCLLCPLRSVF